MTFRSVNHIVFSVTLTSVTDSSQSSWMNLSSKAWRSSVDVSIVQSDPVEIYYINLIVSFFGSINTSRSPISRARFEQVMSWSISSWHKVALRLSIAILFSVVSIRVLIILGMMLLRICDDTISWSTRHREVIVYWYDLSTAVVRGQFVNSLLRISYVVGSDSIDKDSITLAPLSRSTMTILSL